MFGPGIELVTVLRTLAISILQAWKESALFDEGFFFFSSQLKRHAV